MRNPFSDMPVTNGGGPIDTLPSAVHRSNRWPILFTVVMISVIWAAHLQLTSVGGFRFFDEFHALDRSTAFVRHGDWLNVYSKNEVSFRKPPLQYWMSGLLLEVGIEQQVALRLPSLIFALGGMIAVALLAAAVMPGNLWVMPAAVLLFASSTQYWEHAVSAMLEAGAGFFANLALASAILALKRPGWWYIAAIAIALGSLQKAPIGLVLVALYLVALNATARWHGYRYRTIASERPFRIASLIALGGTLAWPAYQTILHGTDAIAEFFGDQMIDRFTPVDAVEHVRPLSNLARLILREEVYLRLPAIAALAWLPWRLGRMDLLPLPIIFAFFAATMLFAGGNVASRYTLIFLPMLAVALAAVILSLAPRLWIAAPAVALVSWASLGPIKSAEDLDLSGSWNYRNQISALSYVGEILLPEETLVICTVGSGKRRIVPPLASYYAANGRPFVRLARERTLKRFLKEGRLDGPLRGICKPEDLRMFKEYFVDLQIEEERNGYLIWTASRGRQD